ncbi:hypothetical protein DFH07DRAFT_771131 [Mycena maculata]|uniref:Uncharacterized protein n=1 Tax=Mycena maculata TaxID=230809 RepID=A0AAD7NIN1_9AGAR|nr:hypothetical protein DFH07DRAFT_771131 [Mycena maculata]
MLFRALIDYLVISIYRNVYATTLIDCRGVDSTLLFEHVLLRVQTVQCTVQIKGYPPEDTETQPPRAVGVGPINKWRITPFGTLTREITIWGLANRMGTPWFKSTFKLDYHQITRRLS